MNLILIVSVTNSEEKEATISLGEEINNTTDYFLHYEVKSDKVAKLRTYTEKSDNELLYITKSKVYIDKLSLIISDLVNSGYSCIGKNYSFILDDFEDTYTVKSKILDEANNLLHNCLNKQ